MSKLKVVKRKIGMDTSSKKVDEYLKNKKLEEIQKVMDTITDIYHVDYEHYSKPLQKSIRSYAGQQARKSKKNSI